MKQPKQVVLAGVIATATRGSDWRCYQEVRFGNPMLPAIVILLFFIGAVMAALTMFVAYAINEHSKHDLSEYITALWVLVGLGGVICFWQTVEVFSRGMTF